MGCSLVCRSDIELNEALSAPRGCALADARCQSGIIAADTAKVHPLGLYGLHPRNTTGTWFTLRDRPGVSVSDRGKLGPSGDMQRPADQLAASWVRWEGVLMMLRTEWVAGRRAAVTASPVRFRVRPGVIYQQHLQSAF
jgi:hypothetical protein